MHDPGQVTQQSSLDFEDLAEIAKVGWGMRWVTRAKAVEIRIIKQ